MNNSQKKNKTFALLRRFAPYYKRYRGTLALDLFCASLTTICELILPLIVRYLTEGAMDVPISLTVRSICLAGGVYILLRIVDAIANYYMAHIGHVMGARIETDMRRDLFSHMHKLSFAYYDNAKVGQLMARITSDLFDVTEFAHHCPEEYFIAALKILISFVILGGINIWLTLIIFALVPIMIVVSSKYNLQLRAAFRHSRHQVGEINSQVEDSLLGIRVVKSFANEKVEKRKFQEGNEEFLEIKQKVYKSMAMFHTTTRIFDGLMYVVVVVAGALFMLNGSIHPADYVAFLLYVTTLLTSIRRIVEFTEQFQRGTTGIERFFEVLDEPIDLKDSENAVDIQITTGDILFRHVTFAYSDSKGNVLTDINLHVHPGDNVALVGPSGCGKTTLANLIPRFYDVSSGSIFIDGVDIKDVRLASLRSQIGMVQQDVYLFSGTIADNIEYGLPGASRSEIIAAAKQAGAHGFIAELENGYDTYVGERGVKLSGGQKQRISIARVFLKNPPILILDEATSALDNESEQLVQESLSALAAGRTTFTIAHRLSTIQNATVILVLTENGIEEKGTHQQLFAKKGIYYRLCQMASPFSV